MAVPRGLTIRMYHVGFGDCFLLTFHYQSGDRQLLIDFGTTRQSQRYMQQVAADIRRRTGEQLDAVVATHRHRDHLSGFATADDPAAASSGKIIAGLAPRLVSMTWTEDPDLDAEAIGPVPGSENLSFLASLRSMQRIATRTRQLAAAERRARRHDVSGALESLAEINIPNKSALQNLLTMSGRGGTEFLHYGKKTRLTRMFRGVKFHVLGPPTVEQSARVQRQTARDRDEYWHLANYWHALERSFLSNGARSEAPFAEKYCQRRKPSYIKWLQQKMLDPTAADLLRISRVMDRALNNTSLILLIEVGGEKLLFSGDAQIESWDYALHGPDAERNRELLSGVSVYKVGHHGSLNGTPKTLWKLFQQRKDFHARGRLVCLLSSRRDIHGRESRGTEVPRQKLVAALNHGSTLIATPWDMDHRKKFTQVGSEVWHMDFD